MFGPFKLPLGKGVHWFKGAVLFRSSIDYRGINGFTCVDSDEHFLFVKLLFIERVMSSNSTGHH